MDREAKILKQRVNVNIPHQPPVADRSMSDWSTLLAEKEILEIISCMDGVVVQIGTEMFYLDDGDYIGVSEERKKNPRFDAICRSTHSLASEGIFLGEVEWACNTGAKLEVIYTFNTDDIDLKGVYIYPLFF